MSPSQVPASAPSVDEMSSKVPFSELPAPWTCRGECFWFPTYVHAKRGTYPSPAAFGELEQGTAFADPTVAGDYEGGLASVIVFRYTDTPAGECSRGARDVLFRESNRSLVRIGPYDELLWIPGNFAVPPGGPAALRITRIYVSTKESVYNGKHDSNRYNTQAHVFSQGERIGTLPKPKPTSSSLPFRMGKAADCHTPRYLCRICLLLTNPSSSPTSHPLS